MTNSILQLQCFSTQKKYFGFLLLIFALSCAERPADKLTGKWEMTMYRINHIDEPEEINVVWEFLNDGEFRQLVSYPEQETREEARWELTGDHILSLFYPDTERLVEWKVIYFQNDTLEVEYTMPGFFVERGFKKISK
jgi:hypothetical protein